MYKVILFFEFLKENEDILENLDIRDLSLETIEDKLVPLARENGFFITAKDIFRFLNEYQKVDSGLINDNMLSEVAGGKGNFNRVMAASLLAITGFTGLINNTHTYAMGNADSSISQSESKTQSVKTIKDQKNNTLSEAEMKYYQEKIGDNYKFVSNKGMSGAFATAYKLEDKNGNEFVLKISNNPENSQRWVQNQRNTDEKIKKYYNDYKGDLKITNYVKFGDDFVIEEYLGERFDPNEIEKYSKDDIQSLINGMAEFLNYSHSKEKTTSLSVDDVIASEHIKFMDAYDYFDQTGALNEDDKKMLLDLINEAENRDKSDEKICALVHTDIRDQNIVYNPKTHKFALIDFDALFVGAPIYLSFTSATIGSFGIPYDIASRIVNKYNDISDTKVSKEKIKLMHKIGTMLELFRCAKYGYKPTQEFIRNELWTNLKARLEKIDKGFEN